MQMVGWQHRWVGLVAVAVALSNAAARADSPANASAVDAGEATSSVVPVPVRFEPSIGIATGGAVNAAAGLGMTAFVLAGPFEIGVSGSGEFQLFTYSRTQIGLLAGVRLQLRRLELDLAGILGTGEMKSGGGTLFSDDPGVSGPVDFTGVRAGAAYPFFVSPRGQVRFGLGLSLAYEHDLNSRLVTYEYRETDDWSGAGSGDDVTATGWIGTSRFVLRVAFFLGLN
jgi:hypothetical protein